MSESLEIEKAGWIERVLGIKVVPIGEKSPKADFKTEWKESYSAWQDAIETVDQQMDALGMECRRTGDRWLMNIANLGLPAVTGGFKTPLMAACFDVSNAPPEKLAAMAAKATIAVKNFKQHIDTNQQVAGCDANPFGVAVSIKATLGPVLKSLEDTLARAS